MIAVAPMENGVEVLIGLILVVALLAVLGWIDNNTRRGP